MSKIHILSEHLSNRIAAGEVIERPASVVKELVENAIDAGAGHIRIEIERAGTRLIAVTDDGSGMDPADALLAFEPHGTSKIENEDDIDRIITLGFRGEAIPSIASISRFTLKTRQANAQEGCLLSVEGGALLANEPCGLAPGTSIQVRDLFFNVPARRKFLKSPPTEEGHITEMVTSLMLPRPEVGFELLLDGRFAIRSPGSADILPRLHVLFGKNYTANLRPVRHCENGMEISGYIGAPGFTRNSRREQRVFINRRAIESPAVYRGIREGYATLTEHGRYFPCILFISMPPEEVDVNVHPAKREVRFKHEFVVSRAVATAVSLALRKPDDPPAATVHPEEIAAAEGLGYQIPMSAILEHSSINYHPARFTQPDLTAAPEKGAAYPAPPGSVLTEWVDIPSREKEDAAEEEAPSPLVFGGDWPREVLGVLDSTYILASAANGLVLIDQHAAHERVLFEDLLAAAETNRPMQKLLLPRTIELPRPAAALLLRTKDFFEKLGFDLESLGGNTVMVNAIPLKLPEGDLASILLDALAELVENQEEKLPIALEFVARAACRAAVKAHDELSFEEARHLLRRLGECRQGTLCPHGRPTMLTIPYTEILRRFGRR